MFFSLCFIAEVVAIVLSLKCESKNSMSAEFHLIENAWSYNDDREIERSSYWCNAADNSDNIEEACC